MMKALTEGPMVKPRKVIPVVGNTPATDVEKSLIEYDVDELLRYQADNQAKSNLILALPNSIYNKIDCFKHNPMLMWTQLEKIMLGTAMSTQLRQTRYMNNFEEFKAKDGESLKSVFDRFWTVINDLYKIKVIKNELETNMKFLNALKPEWEKSCHRMRNDPRISKMPIQDMFEILMSDEAMVLKKKAKLDKQKPKTVDPIALLASQMAEQVLTESAYDGSTDDDGEALEKAMILLSQHYQKKYQKRTGSNNLRFSSGSKKVEPGSTSKPFFPKYESGTAAEPKKEEKKAVTCYNYGKPGHISKECRTKIVKDVDFYKKKLALAEKKASGTILLAEEEYWLDHSDNEADNVETAAMCFIGDDNSDDEDEDTSTDESELLWPIICSSLFLFTCDCTALGSTIGIRADRQKAPVLQGFSVSFAYHVFEKFSPCISKGMPSSEALSISMDEMPPVLYRGEYDKWRIQFLDFIDKHDLGDYIRLSLREGKMETPTDIYEQRKRFEADKLSKAFILQGIFEEISKEISVSLDSKKATGKQLWEHLETIMTGTMMSSRIEHQKDTNGELQKQISDLEQKHAQDKSEFEKSFAKKFSEFSRKCVDEKKEVELKCIKLSQQVSDFQKVIILEREKFATEKKAIEQKNVSVFKEISGQRNNAEKGFEEERSMFETEIKRLTAKLSELSEKALKEQRTKPGFTKKIDLLVKERDNFASTIKVLEKSVSSTNQKSVSPQRSVKSFDRIRKTNLFYDSNIDGSGIHQRRRRYKDEELVWKKKPVEDELKEKESCVHAVNAKKNKVHKGKPDHIYSRDQLLRTRSSTFRPGYFANIQGELNRSISFYHDLKGSLKVVIGGDSLDLWSNPRYFEILILFQQKYVCAMTRSRSVVNPEMDPENEVIVEERMTNVNPTAIQGKSRGRPKGKAVQKTATQIGISNVGTRGGKTSRGVESRRKPIEFQIGDKVMLKVSHWKGVVRFGKKGKLRPRFLGPFIITSRVGEVAYELDLLESLCGIHSTFHVSNLKKCLAEADIVVPLEDIQVDEKLSYIEEPIAITDLKIKFTIPIISEFEKIRIYTFHELTDTQITDRPLKKSVKFVWIKKQRSEEFVSLEDNCVDFLCKQDSFAFCNKSTKYSVEQMFQFSKNSSDSDDCVSSLICDDVHLNQLWYLDSGCSKHMTGNKSLLTNFKEKCCGRVKFGNYETAPILGYGDLVQGNITVKRVRYVEGLSHNLFSIGKFCDKDLEVRFKSKRVAVKNSSGLDLLFGKRRSNLYTINLSEVKVPSDVCLLSKASIHESWVWYRRLAHLNFKYMDRLVKNDSVRGLSILRFQKDHLCQDCEKGKMKKASHKPKPEHCTADILDLIHVDLCRPMKTKSIGKKKYVLVVVDDYSRYTWNSTLQAFYDDQGTQQQFSAARTPQQNAVVERRNRTLVEAARSMLAYSGLPLSHWAEAISTACYTQNRSILHRRFNKTPYELMNGIKPNIKYFKSFGCKCYVLNDRDNLNKFSPKADEGVFLGYSSNSAAYRVFLLSARKVIESVNVKFDEAANLASGQHSSEPAITGNSASEQISSELALQLTNQDPSTSLSNFSDLDFMFENFYDDVPKQNIDNVSNVLNQEFVSASNPNSTTSTSEPDAFSESPEIQDIPSEHHPDQVFHEPETAETIHEVSVEDEVVPE
ncbi:hypothetical protein L6452_22221 [Arctium lappa]|uniref:Uncharacterized protein n=1 Tax=Arctium lappa TaxID=4217 RepID=A0ACB9B0V7_ARCLA|nr:hypothetical protein L6452_22221 [Arctium lappa]